jgi:hypothetical protein
LVTEIETLSEDPFQDKSVKLIPPLKDVDAFSMTFWDAGAVTIGGVPDSIRRSSSVSAET